MLQRIISGAVIVLLLLGAVLLLPRAWSAAALSLVLLAAAVEWSGFIDTRWSVRRVAFLALVLLDCLALWRLSATEAGLTAALGLALAFWTSMAAWVFLLPHKTGRMAVFVAGVLALPLAWMALVRMRLDWTSGPEAVLYALLIVWFADSGAYFVGRAWGVRKLAPSVSPGKTVAGFWGGVAACALLGVFAGLWLGQGIGTLVAVTVVTGLYSVVGDLLESHCKRFAGLKDSGTLIPGHGGVLDRFDSLLAAAPCLMFGLAVAGGVWR
ncbi:MAG TPA: phosphatidate cytidylyltransferase [Steroidobacteraceae bacterium]|nr:phosphatidate cytidylyltransferase [Steroidobacteraceae bacterium]